MIDAPTACFRPANLVTIRGTRDRSRFPEGYSVVVGPRLAKQMGIGRWAVLAFEHPALAEVRDGLNFCNPYIAVHCQVVKDARLDAEEAVIEVDQTLRNALGIPLRIFRDLGSMPVFLLPARRTFWNRLGLGAARLFGIRFVVFRCKSASVPDIEKGYVRAPIDASQALGAQDFDKVSVERSFAVTDTEGFVQRFDIRARTTSLFPASSEFLAEREELSRLFPARYPNARLHLYDYGQFVEHGFLSRSRARASMKAGMIEPDLPPLFMDLDMRRMGVGRYPGQAADHSTALVVRRSILSAVARDSTQTGVIFSLGVVQVLLAFDFVPGVTAWEEIAVSLLVGLAAAVVFTIARLRQQV
ncbi:MAG: hypothetical protein KF910_11805 [Brevundimonas sp.]|uniref:hypothetical protein n=1 Tax=Brevundimonas sp. TaxID=1871086 RepID=UPI0025BB4734|nr:hypothetical protein [Brevundimonas sp.]MBX3478287.1 hypothetical protein [Brevundimonas sp.]